MREAVRPAKFVPGGDVLRAAEIGDGSRGIGETHAGAFEQRADHFHRGFDLHRDISLVDAPAPRLDAP